MHAHEGPTIACDDVIIHWSPQTKQCRPAPSQCIYSLFKLYSKLMVMSYCASTCQFTIHHFRVYSISKTYRFEFIHYIFCHNASTECRLALGFIMNLNFPKWRFSLQHLPHHVTPAPYNDCFPQWQLGYSRLKCHVTRKVNKIDLSYEPFLFVHTQQLIVVFYCQLQDFCNPEADCRSLVTSCIVVGANTSKCPL